MRVRCIYEPEENHLVREIQKIGGQIVESGGKLDLNMMKQAMQLKSSWKKHRKNWKK
jgi:hypothetical protein